MLAFRSELHVERWCEEHAIPKGACVPVEQCWALARAWYADRLDPAWRRRGAAETQSLFDSAGLSGEFWRVV